MSKRPGGPFAEVILDACLHSKARDAQVEGSRAQYMFDIVQRTANPSFYIRKVLDALSDEADEWDALQRFGMARLLAQDGNNHARQAMTEAFERQIGSPIQDAFAEEFIALDGIPGLLFAAGRIGRGLRADSSRWEDDSLLAAAEELFGQEAVWNSITERGKTDADVLTYVDAVKANRLLRQQHRIKGPSSFSFEQIRSMIASRRIEVSLPEWGKIANPAELELAASDLIIEVDSARLLSYLLIFRKRAFPLGCDHLLQLAGMPDVPVARHALIVLENVQDDKVRRHALRLIEERSPHRGYAIGLLRNNFRQGDSELVKAWCDDEGDPEILNSFDRGLREFFSVHPNDSAESQILTNFYDREPCSHCRWFIVKRLLELKKLSEDLRAESIYDSDLGTRALVNAQ
ncbi:MAG: hypothetical protein ACLQVM_14235 [Terriglobia bacterium]